MAVYIVAGAPGVGKTTVLNEAVKGKELKIVVFGDVMFETAKELGLAQSKDEMRSKIGPADYRKIQETAADAIAAMGNVIVDTHVSVKRPDGYYPGLPEWVLKKLNPKCIILIEADPKEIENRRTGDATRERSDLGGAAHASEHQDMNRAFVAACSVLSGCLVKIIRNERDKLAESAKELNEVFE
jgi:adenylate kinase